jgi:TRAP-type mannitol/chloroaromatic compound transport system substrate-binding protein
MQRRNFLQRAGAGVALGALGSSAEAQGLPEVRWRLQSDFARSQDLLHGAAAGLAERIAAMTGGRFRIEVLPRDDVATGRPLIDGVREGIVDACHAEANAFFDIDPVFAFFGAMPYGMTARQQDAWMHHGGGLQLLRGALQRHGVTGFPAGGTGIQMGGWFRREMKTTADLKGLRMRSGGFGGAVLARLGGVPQKLADREATAALEAGRIDAVEGIGPYDDEKQGFYKTAKFYHYPLGSGDGNQLAVLVNLKAWTALPGDYRAVFEAASIAAGVDVRARYDALNPRALRQLLANGVQLRPFPQEVAKAAFVAADEAYAETQAANNDFRQVYTGWKAFRDEQIRAYGFSDARTQGFMHAAILAQGPTARK